MVGFFLDLDLIFFSIVTDLSKRVINNMTFQFTFFLPLEREASQDLPLPAPPSTAEKSDIPTIILFHVKCTNLAQHRISRYGSRAGGQGVR